MLMGSKQRFMRHVACGNSKEECWLWVGARGRDGYGVFKFQQKTDKAHRVSWMLHNGAIPIGMHILHRCDVPWCVNPCHLFPGTPRQNVLDMFAKGRNSNPPRDGKRKLSNTEANDVRERYSCGVSIRQLAGEYKVARNTIRLIIKNKTYKSLGAQATFLTAGQALNRVVAVNTEFESQVPITQSR